MATSKVGIEQVINPTSGGFYFTPDVTDLSDGRFALGFSDSTSGNFDSRLQLLGGTSAPAQINLETGAINSFNVKLDQLPGSGDIATAWAINNQIFTSVVTTAGTLRGGPTLVANLPATAVEFEPELAARTSGSYVVGFDTLTGLNRDVDAVFFNSTGAKIGDLNVPAAINDAATQRDSAFATLSGDRTVMVWSTNSASAGQFGTDVNGTFGLRAAIFDVNGNLERNVGLVNFDPATSPAGVASGDQIQASVATLANGDFVVTWTDDSGSKGDNSGTAVFARVYDSNGNAKGNSFQVNTTIAGDQRDADVAALSGGGFVVTWTDSSGANTDIRSRAFDATGVATDAADAVVNTTTIGNQTNSEVIGLQNNQFVVTWQDPSSAPNGAGGQSARYQILQDAPPTPPAGAPVANNDFGGTVPEGGSAAGNVLDNDTDPPNAQALSVALVNGLPITASITGTYGTLTIQSNGSFTYQANLPAAAALSQGESVTETFTYTASDSGLTDDASLSFTVTGVGAPPPPPPPPSETFEIDALKPKTRISDFDTGVDVIELDTDVFEGLGTSVLKNKNFVISDDGRATKAKAQIIYDTDSGKLFYDSDGTGNAKAKNFAILEGAPDLSRLDFDLI